MKFSFARGLESCYEDFEVAKKRWGEAVARKFIQRVGIIKAVRELQELRTIRALRLHELKGEREGTYTIYLNGRWRLVFAYNEEEKSVMILEVSNHYGD